MAEYGRRPGSRRPAGPVPAGSAGVGSPGSILTVLGSHGELPAGDLVAGQGMPRLLRRARALGVTVTVLAGPVELGERELSAARPGRMP
jgi:hypothetical protein